MYVSKDVLSSMYIECIFVYIYIHTHIYKYTYVCVWICIAMYESFGNLLASF